MENKRLFTAKAANTTTRRNYKLKKASEFSQHQLQKCEQRADSPLSNTFYGKKRESFIEYDKNQRVIRPNFGNQGNETLNQIGTPQIFNDQKVKTGGGSVISSPLKKSQRSVRKGALQPTFRLQNMKEINKKFYDFDPQGQKQNTILLSLIRKRQKPSMNAFKNRSRPYNSQNKTQNLRHGYLSQEPIMAKHTLDQTQLFLQNQEETAPFHVRQRSNSSQGSLLEQKKHEEDSFEVDKDVNKQGQPTNSKLRKKLGLIGLLNLQKMFDEGGKLHKKQIESPRLKDQIYRLAKRKYREKVEQVKKMNLQELTQRARNKGSQKVERPQITLDDIQNSIEFLDTVDDLVVEHQKLKIVKKSVEKQLFSRKQSQAMSSTMRTADKDYFSYFSQANNKSGKDSTVQVSRMLIKEKEDPERVSFYNQEDKPANLVEDPEEMYKREIPKYLQKCKEKQEKRTVTKIQLSKTTERQKNLVKRLETLESTIDNFRDQLDQTKIGLEDRKFYVRKNWTSVLSSVRKSLREAPDIYLTNFVVRQDGTLDASKKAKKEAKKEADRQLVNRVIMESLKYNPQQSYKVLFQQEEEKKK